jgi:hypothetical protein
MVHNVNIYIYLGVGPVDDVGVGDVTIGAGGCQGGKHTERVLSEELHDDGQDHLLVHVHDVKTSDVDLRTCEGVCVCMYE